MMNEKKFQILTTAMTMFYQHGIHAVGINEIIKESGVAKKTMYNHFVSKEALIVETLKLRSEHFIDWLYTLMESADVGRDSIICLFEGLNDWFNDKVEELGAFRGCYFTNASAEYSEDSSPIFQACTEHKNHIMALISTQLAYYLTDSEKIQQLAEQLCMLKEGAINHALVKNDKQAALKALTAVKILLADN